MEKARMDKEGTLGNKSVGSTEVKEIVKQEELIDEVQGLGTGWRRTSTANLAAMASPSRSLPG
jgi:hypothetical protein